MGEIASGQIVYLEHRWQRLYAEAIQVVADRRRCWARPLFLVEAHASDDGDENFYDYRASAFQTMHPTEVTCYSLVGCSDILWPVSQFRLALDTEVLTLLPQVQNKILDPDTHPQRPTHDCLRRFINQLWESSDAV